jgi:hypothetical protein
MVKSIYGGQRRVTRQVTGEELLMIAGVIDASANGNKISLPHHHFSQRVIVPVQ